ncbi:MAG: cell wall-binding repeat-containing protein, partial [Actinomycetes bacterium]
MSRPRSAPTWAARAAVLSLVATTAATGGAALGAQQVDRSDEGTPRLAATERPGAGRGPERGPEVDMATLRVPRSAARTAVQHAHRDAGRADRVPSEDAAEVVARRATTRTDDFGLVGVTWPAGHDSRGLHVEVRTHDADGWSGWSELPVETVDVRHEPGARAGTLPAWVGDADGVAVRMLSDAGTAPEDVEVALIDGGTGLAEDAEGDQLPAGQVGRPAPTLALGAMTEGSGVVEQPDIVMRDEWGVDSSTEVECSSPRTADTMRGIVLHHTAGGNDYTPEQAPGIVRGIHRYHTVSQGWCDIGYNFLVDKYGTVYEGRRGGITNQVRGAHAGDALVNKWTTGISMMGNFETATVPAALKDAVVRLSAWRLWLFGRQAEDSMLIDDVPYQRISGHRDFKSTACPGKNGYAWLNGGMRAEVQAVLDAAGPAPSDPEPTTEPTPTTEPEPTPSPEPEPEPEPVLRYSGESRYTTAAAIAQESFPGPVDSVFLASGTTYPDALSGGPAAARNGSPVLLTRPGALPAETAAELDRLQPRVVYVLGGPGAVSDEVLAQAQQHAPTVTRLAGSNRYVTGTAISRQFWSQAGTVYLASGETYPDALSGGALA